MMASVERPFWYFRCLFPSFMGERGMLWAFDGDALLTKARHKRRCGVSRGHGRGGGELVQDWWRRWKNREEEGATRRMGVHSC